MDTSTSTIQQEYTPPVTYMWWTQTLKPKWDEKWTEEEVLQQANWLFKYFKCFVVAERTKRGVYHFHCMAETLLTVKQFKKQVDTLCSSTPQLETLWGFRKVVEVKSFWGCVTYMKKDICAVIRDDLKVFEQRVLPFNWNS